VERTKQRLRTLSASLLADRADVDCALPRRHPLHFLLKIITHTHTHTHTHNPHIHMRASVFCWCFSQAHARTHHDSSQFGQVSRDANKRHQCSGSGLAVQSVAAKQPQIHHRVFKVIVLIAWKSSKVRRKQSVSQSVSYTIKPHVRCSLSRSHPSDRGPWAEAASARLPGSHASEPAGTAQKPRIQS
jgi:hypothetical protein